MGGLGLDLRQYLDATGSSTYQRHSLSCQIVGGVVVRGMEEISLKSVQTRYFWPFPLIQNSDGGAYYVCHVDKFLYVCVSTVNWRMVKTKE